MAAMFVRVTRGAHGPREPRARDGDRGADHKSRHADEREPRPERRTQRGRRPGDWLGGAGQQILDLDSRLADGLQPASSDPSRDTDRTSRLSAAGVPAGMACQFGSVFRTEASTSEIDSPSKAR